MVREIVIEGPGPNALSPEGLTRLEEDLAAAGGQPVLLRGAGRAFSAGLDLRALAQLGPAETRAFLAQLERAVRRLFLYPGPTVAWVNGHAVAGGCMIAACCDWRVAAPSERTRIGLNAVSIGLSYPPVVLAILRYRLAPRSLEEVLLGAQLWSPSEALDRGLLDQLGPEAAARDRLARLAQIPATAYDTTKQALRQPILQIPTEARQRYDQAVARTWLDPSIRAGLLAHLSRGSGRAP